jgi:pilus assembly protein FimV
VNKSGKSSIFKASLLVALLGTAFGSQAAGLGKLTVYSAIGQPLNAEVSLTATPEELTALSAKLASHAAFSDAGIDFMPALAGLRFSVAKLPGGQPVLRLTTDSPLNEPFLHFLVELNWTAGRMVREYTFLLDPPEMLQVGKPAPYMPVVPPVQGVASKSAPVKAVAPAAAAVPTRPATTGLRASGTPSGQAGSAGEYQVKSGDTLGKIARDHKVESVSLDQMLVALFNNNRDVFDGNNMNRLRAGKILRLPDSADAAKLDGGEARKLIVSQAADFNAYRRRLAEAAGTAPAVAAAPQQQVAGKIKPQVETKAVPASAADKLEVSRTEAAKTGKAGGGGKSNLEEDLIARDKSLREAAERIAQLEKNLENLKHLVELKSQPGAQVQQQAQAAAATKPAEEKKPEVPAAKPVEAAPVASVPALPAAAVTPPAPVPVAPVPATEKPLEPASPAVTPESAKLVEPPKAPESPVAPAPDVKKPAPPPPTLTEPSFVEDNPELVFGGGGLVALLLSYLGFTAWRKKKQASKQAEFVDHPSVSESDLAAKSGTVFGAASESVDSGEVSIQGDFSEGGVLTTEENVDPVAEADVLMAYGRDGQAEEILKEGLKSDPTRGAIHLKLLELYANRKSIPQFEAVAKDLHGLNGGRGAEWEKAADLARALGVTGGLFPGAVAVAAVEPVEPEKVAAEPLVVKAASEAAVPEVAPVVQEAPPTPEADVGSLDFDLDLGTTSGPAIAAIAEQAAAKPAAEEVMSLDFDFDLGTPEPAGIASAPAVAEKESAAAESVAAAGDHAIDFSLDLGEGAAAVSEMPVAPETSEPEVLASTSATDIDFDLDLGSEMPAADEGPGPVAGLPSGSMSDALGLADISLDLGEAEVVTPMAGEGSLGELKLPELEVPVVEAKSESGMDLDLALDDGGAVIGIGAETQTPELKMPEAEQVAPPIDFSVELPDIELSVDLPAPVAEQAVSPSLVMALPEIELDSVAEPMLAAAGSDADDPEVATKLELAQAYEEMGDREGARELLNEVLSEGSAAQQATARSRLDQLAV